MKTLCICTCYIILAAAQLFCTAVADTGRKLAAPDRGMYHTAFPNFGDTEDSVYSQQIPDFVRLSGKKIVWACFSNNWLNRKINFPLKSVSLIHDAGVIPFIRVCPRSDWKDPTQNLSDPGYYTLQKIADGVFDTEIKEWAKAAASVKYTLCVDFAPEMNGDWFYWDGLHNNTSQTQDAQYPGPSRYVAAYKHFVDICRSNGATNITWFIHFDAEGANSSGKGGPWNAMKNYYPGDAYVDWIGVSCYGATGPREKTRFLSNAFSSRIYNELTNISSSKPLALLEFGTPQTMAPDTQPQWMDDAFKELTAGTRWPKIKAICWWHSNYTMSNSLIKMRIDASSNSLARYRAGIEHKTFVFEPIFTHIQYNPSSQSNYKNSQPLPRILYGASLHIPKGIKGKIGHIDVYTLTGKHIAHLEQEQLNSSPLNKNFIPAPAVYPAIWYFK